VVQYLQELVASKVMWAQDKTDTHTGVLLFINQANITITYRR